MKFDEVTAAWDAAGEGPIHPFDPDSQEFWDLGWAQAEQVAEYAKSGAKVVDFGCGNGRLSIPLVGMGYDVLAVDASQNMLDALKRRAKDVGAEVPVALSDGSDLAKALGRKKADVVISRAVLIHHDFAGVERIVNDLAKALKKGGYLIADWPIGAPQERQTHLQVTVWDAARRLEVAKGAGLELVDPADVSVWRKL